MTRRRGPRIIGRATPHAAGLALALNAIFEDQGNDARVVPRDGAAQASNCRTSNIALHRTGARPSVSACVIRPGISGNWDTS